MNTFKIISILLLSLIFFSCNKGEDEATGIGDALIVTKRLGSSDVYGLSLYAYTYSSFKSVVALSTAEVGKTYTFKSNQGFKTNYVYDTPDAQYTTTKPVASTFNFTAIFENGVTDEFQDILSDKALATPIIDTCQYNSTKNLIRLTWKPVTDAESYAINIIDGTTLLFGSTELPKTITGVSISKNVAGWVSAPVAGKTYKVKVYAYLYEAEKSSYHLQCVSISETEVVWGD
jgi:hypothetical protein